MDTKDTKSVAKEKETKEAEEEGYAIFKREMEDTVRRDHDFIVVDELNIQIRRKWKALSHNDKRKYVLMERNGGKIPIDKRLEAIRCLKKPTPPFFKFSNEFRKQIKRDNPETTAQEISSLVSEAWSNLSKDEKRHLQSQYDYDLQNYTYLTTPTPPTPHSLTSNSPSSTPTSSNTYLKILSTLTELSTSLTTPSAPISDKFQKLLSLCLTTPLEDLEMALVSRSVEALEGVTKKLIEVKRVLEGN
jgi:hypothetical protein